MSLILASGSKIRAKLLRNAGLDLTVQTTPVDESAIKAANGTLATPVLATTLAEAKALAVSAREQKALVIGADQILAFGDRRFDKPATLAEAERQLKTLRGETHELVSAVTCAEAGHIVWSHVSIARLTMRRFSDAFVDTYVAQQGDDLLTSVGAYKLEGAGIQLFEKIDGDYFTILGLPLFPLLSFLRSKGLVAT